MNDQGAADGSATLAPLDRMGFWQHRIIHEIIARPSEETPGIVRVPEGDVRRSEFQSPLWRGEKNRLAADLARIRFQRPHGVGRRSSVHRKNPIIVSPVALVVLRTCRPVTRSECALGREIGWMGEPHLHLRTDGTTGGTSAADEPDGTPQTTSGRRGRRTRDPTTARNRPRLHGPAASPVRNRAGHERRAAPDARHRPPRPAFPWSRGPSPAAPRKPISGSPRGEGGGNRISATGFIHIFIFRNAGHSPATAPRSHRSRRARAA